MLLTPIQIPDFMNAILSLNLKPVFVEIDKQTNSIDISDLEKKINSKTKVILDTYLTGILPDVSRIQSICEKNNIFLIEDISQSYGSLCDNKKAGSFGFAAIGSLSIAKIISSIGGGFILIDDKEKMDYIEKDLKNDLSPVQRKTLLKICVFYIKVSIATSKIVFNFLKQESN